MKTWMIIYFNAVHCHPLYVKKEFTFPASMIPNALHPFFHPTTLWNLLFSIHHNMHDLKWRHMGEGWICNLSLPDRSTCKNDQYFNRQGISISIQHIVGQPIERGYVPAATVSTVPCHLSSFVLDFACLFSSAYFKNLHGSTPEIPLKICS